MINSKIGGESAEGLYEKFAGKYRNTALDDYKNRKNKKYGTSIITTKE